MTDWFARPILNVKDVEASLRFYINRLGFTSPWRHDEDGEAHVAQVERQGCAMILARSWPEKTGKGLIFISLDAEPETQVAALHALRAELEDKGVPVKESSWGYQLLVVDDLDGNQLFFNYPSENASSKTASEIESKLPGGFDVTRCSMSGYEMACLSRTDFLSIAHRIRAA